MPWRGRSSGIGREPVNTRRGEDQHLSPYYGSTVVGLSLRKGMRPGQCRRQSSWWTGCQTCRRLSCPLQRTQPLPSREWQGLIAWLSVTQLIDDNSAVTLSLPKMDELQLLTGETVREESCDKIFSISVSGPLVRKNWNRGKPFWD